MRPEYFPEGSRCSRPGRDRTRCCAAWVFAGTMALLIAPKLMAYVTLLASERRRDKAARAALACCSRPSLAALIAPSMMVFQSRAVTEILLGRDAGWQVQRRDDGAVPRAEVRSQADSADFDWSRDGARRLQHFGAAAVVDVAGRPRPADLDTRGAHHLATLEQARRAGDAGGSHPPEVVARAAELAAAPRPVTCGALARLRDDEDLAAAHLANLPAAISHKGGRIDTALATARAKLDLCDSFADAEGWLDKKETRAVLGDRGLTRRVLDLA